MPLLIHAVSCWLLGLFVAALAHATGGPWPVSALVIITRGCCLALVLCGIAAWRRVLSSRVPTLIAVVLAAVLLSDSDARQRTRCIASLVNVQTLRPTLTLALDDRAAAGRRVLGVATGNGTLAHCTVLASLRVQEGDAPPGAIVSFAGTVRATDVGVRLDGVITPTGRVDVLRSWRGRTGERIDTLFRRNASLVRALLIADQRGIAPDVRDRFADAGLVHMLSISGLHVAIIATALLTLGSALRLSRRLASIAALVVVVVYVAILGAPAPAVRSAVMLATVALTERWQRPVHPWTALALGAAIPTVQPSVVLDLGWQLSVAGMAALVAAGALFRRVRHGELPVRAHRHTTRVLRWVRALKGWRWTLTRECCTGVIATVVTAPIIAWTFGRVSLIAPLSNLAAGPVVAFVQPALFVAMLLSPWPRVAKVAADACVAPLALLDRIASVSAAIPWASLHVAPTLPAALCAGFASALFVRATASRRWMSGFLLAAAALCVAVWTPVLQRGAGQLELHMIDVGQGDALALRTPRGRWVLIDAGRRWEGGDAGRRVVVPYVQRRGGAVAAFVLTHAHDDHAGGAASVVEALHPSQWWEPAFVTGSDGYRRALEAVRHRAVPWHRVQPGDALQLDGVRIEVLAPDATWTAAQHDANETSVVLRVTYGDVVFILTGDAQAQEEAWIVAHASQLRADVLKVGHHGSRTSSSAAFVDAVQPVLALVSVGADNRYGHPSPETVQAFALRGIPLLRTDRDGTVMVATDGHVLHVQAHREQFTLDPAVARRSP